MPDLLTSFNFVIEWDNGKSETFRKMSGITMETEVIEHKEVTAQGKMIIRKVPGAHKWGEVTLERRKDSSTALQDWHKKVTDGDIDGARCSGTIHMKDSMGSTVSSWNFENAWPSKYSQSDVDAGSNEIALETIVIQHEGMFRA
jgi:phage tail-like protein